jgi:dihydroneopterin aldolase
VAIASASRGTRHLFVRDLMLACRIGVHPHEHAAPQRVRVNLDLGVIDQGAPKGDSLAGVVDYAQLVQRVRSSTESGHVNLVETLAERLASLCLEDARVRSARVRIEKLDALADVAAVGVEIERLNPRASP